MLYRIHIWVVNGNLEPELLHQQLHDVVHVSVDVEVGLLEVLGRLKVADYKFTRIVIFLEKKFLENTM